MIKFNHAAMIQYVIHLILGGRGEKEARKKRDKSTSLESAEWRSQTIVN